MKSKQQTIKDLYDLRERLNSIIVEFEDSEYQEITPELLKDHKIEIDVKPPVIPIEKNEGFKTELPREWATELMDITDPKRSELEKINQLLQALRERDERIVSLERVIDLMNTVHSNFIQKLDSLEKQVKELEKGNGEMSSKDRSDLYKGIADGNKYL